MKGRKNQKFILAHTQMLGQYDEGYNLKIDLLNFIKLSVEFQLIEI